MRYLQSQNSIKVRGRIDIIETLVPSKEDEFFVPSFLLRFVLMLPGCKPSMKLSAIFRLQSFDC